MAPVELASAFAGRRVLVTGHTGFKGSWLVTWLAELGATVTGFALPPPAGEPAMFTLLDLARRCDSHEGDIRDLARLRDLVRRCRPEVVFHLAAQPLVRRSYDSPLETLDVNVRGTATVLEALRLEAQPVAVVVVTSDKCYRNTEQARAYSEDDALGGHDPYSASKAAAELVVESYRQSFFAPARIARHGVAIATARAGNVIGGGDWGHERLLPTVAAALAAGRPVELRAPEAVRPWQHVLDPLNGYLQLGARLAGFGGEAAGGGPETFTGAWNFGPPDEASFTVGALVDQAIRCWGEGALPWVAVPAEDGKHEATRLQLATGKAAARLGWGARLALPEAVTHTIAWYRAYHDGASAGALRALTLGQIDSFQAAPAPVRAPARGDRSGRLQVVAGLSDLRRAS